MAMTIEDGAIQLARHYFRGGSSDHADLTAKIVAFASAYAKVKVLQERNECAEIADAQHWKYKEPTEWDYGAQNACAKLAGAIRARPQP